MIKRELTFLLALWKANLLSAMEYRAAFLSQVFGMILNNGVYFIFWVIFFDKFKQVRGWGLSDMIMLFGVVAAGFGIAEFLFGNFATLAEIISTGKLDYYLSLPRPVLLHVLASRSIPAGLGDFTYGIGTFFLSGQITLDAFARFVLGALLAMVVFLSFMVLVQSLAFFLGNAQLLTQQAMNAMITFSIYPITLFDNTAKFLLFTVAPAAFMGAIPAEYVRSASPGRLLVLLGGAAIFLILALAVFNAGLRRYESGSAIQVQM
jgi:ABC-2 type transport system permease protein